MKRGWIPITIVSFIFSTCHVRADSAPAALPQQATESAPAPQNNQDDPSMVAGSAINPEFAADPAPETTAEDATDTAAEPIEDPQVEETYFDQDGQEIKYVSEETPEQVKKKKNKYWHNILLAAAAVAVAVVALILVSQNNGRHAHSHKK
jgi:hypothetical protein